MANRRLRIVAAVLGIVLLAALAATGSMALAYRAIPQSEKGSAYTVGVKFALSSDNLHDIWAGRTPTFVFRRREFDMGNRYVWQPATLTRPSKCLDAAGPDGARLALPDECRIADTLVRRPDRLYFSVDDKRTISVGVTNAPPNDGRVEGRGAMFGVEGEIGIGRTLKTTSFVKIDLSASGVNLMDLGATPPDNQQPEDEGHSEVGGCDQPRLVSLHDPFVLRLLPATAARLCRFQFEDKSVLSIVQYQLGAMQVARWFDVVMCRALLAELLPHDAEPGAAACVGAHWAAFERAEVSLVLFELAQGSRLALTR